MDVPVQSAAAAYPPQADMSPSAGEMPAVPPPVQEYAGKLPSQPRPAKPRQKKTPTLVVILIVLVAVLAVGCIAFVIFDALNLYCEIPSVTNFFIPGACPP
jgi:hypothetical protein